MKIPKTLKIGDAIEVIWIDTQTPKESGWLGTLEYAAFRKTPMIMKNVGMFRYCDGDYLGLYGCADMGGDEITLPIAIPIGCIKSIRRLK